MAISHVLMDGPKVVGPAGALGPTVTEPCGDGEAVVPGVGGAMEDGKAVPGVGGTGNGVGGGPVGGVGAGLLEDEEGVGGDGGKLPSRVCCVNSVQKSLSSPSSDDAPATSQKTNARTSSALKRNDTPILLIL